MFQVILLLKRGERSSVDSPPTFPLMGRGVLRQTFDRESPKQSAVSVHECIVSVQECIAVSVQECNTVCVQECIQ